MTPPAEGPDGEVRDAIPDRFTAETTPLGRVMFWVVLAMLGAVGLARLTGHGDLAAENADLMAVVAGLAGIAWLPRMIRVGEIRIDRKGHWTVRRDERTALFWTLVVLYGLGFLGFVLAGWLHRTGRLTL